MPELAAAPSPVHDARAGAGSHGYRHLWHALVWEGYRAILLPPFSNSPAAVVPGRALAATSGGSRA